MSPVQRIPVNTDLLMPPASLEFIQSKTPDVTAKLWVIHYATIFIEHLLKYSSVNKTTLGQSKNSLVKRSSLQ